MQSDPAHAPEALHRTGQENGGGELGEQEKLIHKIEIVVEGNRSVQDRPSSET
jgi:hypothetical protein